MFKVLETLAELLVGAFEGSIGVYFKETGIVGGEANFLDYGKKDGSGKEKQSYLLQLWQLKILLLGVLYLNLEITNALRMELAE